MFTDQTDTQVSADGKITTILRDSEGGGWYDQREVRTTHSDGHRTVSISDLAPNGAVIRTQTSSVSIDGKTNTETADYDSNGSTDLTSTRLIVINANNSRIETITETNSDASLRDKVTMSVSADGRSKVTDRDLDGNATTDIRETTVIVVNGDGSTNSTNTVTNNDGSLREKVTVSQSANALSKTETHDINGDGVNDQTTTNVTVVNADTSRSETVSVFSGNGTLQSKTVTTLGADKITSTVKADTDGNGVNDSETIVSFATIAPSTVQTTSVTSNYKPDGTLINRSTSVSSFDTNTKTETKTTTTDIDGNTTIDLKTIDVTVTNTNLSSTHTITHRNGNDSLRDQSYVDTSANGKIITTHVDADGNNVYELTILDSTVVNINNGSYVRTVTESSSDGNLLSKTVESMSADRRTQTISADANGDDHDDRIITSVEAANGSTTTTIVDKNADGTVASQSISIVSANELVSTIQTDANGDGAFETVVSDATVLNVNGSRTETELVKNGDGSLREKTVKTTSDDGLSVTIQRDVTGDEVFDFVTQDVKVLNTNGSTTETVSNRSADNSLISKTVQIVSDDGLSSTTTSDVDGDGTVDFTSTDLILLNADGSRVQTVTVTDGVGDLVSRTVTTANTTLRSVSVARDINGDGAADITEVTSVAVNGVRTSELSVLDENGMLQQRTVTTLSANGLIQTVDEDVNGDAIYDQRTITTDAILADGSSTETTEVRSYNNTLLEKTIVTTSDDGLSKTTTIDWNGDNAIDRTQTELLVINANGSTQRTTVLKNADNSVRDKTVVTTSADHRDVTTAYNAGSDAFDDWVSSEKIGDDGTKTTTIEFFSSGGTLIAVETNTVSADGLTETVTRDRNADGIIGFSENRSVFVSASGSVTEVITERDGHGNAIYRSTKVTSDNGLLNHIQQDFNGNGTIDLSIRTVSVIGGNGDVTTTTTTDNSANQAIRTVVDVAAANGLFQSTTVDKNADGVVDEMVRTFTFADGSKRVETLDQYGLDLSTASEVRLVSADGRVEELYRNLTPDLGTSIFSASASNFDIAMIRETDLSGNTITAYHEQTTHIGASDITSDIEVFESANGQSSVTSFNFDGDSVIDLQVTETRVVNQDGSTTETYDSNYRGALGHREIVETSANRLIRSVKIDLGGDDSIDETINASTVFTAAGEKIETSSKTYSNGSVIEKVVATTSADGRLETYESDFNGDGIRELTVTTQTLSDGTLVSTSTYFNVAGYRMSEDRAVTSLGGLKTVHTFDNGTVETTEFTANGRGAYVWTQTKPLALSNNTKTVSTRQTDAEGVAQWTLSIQTVTNGTTATNTYVASLSEKDLNEFLNSAADLYDTVLDRDMTKAEIEGLLQYYSGAAHTAGSAAATDLLDALLVTQEFKTKYGVPTNGDLPDTEYISIFYRNALGRAPTLAELDAIISVKGGEGVAQALADSLEHDLIGNTHLKTNNSDFRGYYVTRDHVIDEELANVQVMHLFDVVLDRAATASEIKYYSDQILKSDVTLGGVAASLFALAEATSLRGMGDANFVDALFLNAFGRAATQTEITNWSNYIDAPAGSSYGSITKAALIAAIAESPEHLGIVVTHVSTPATTYNVINGTAGNDGRTGTTGADQINGLAGGDVIHGGEGDDKIIGGLDIDLLNDHEGNERYEWTRGDGADTINDAGPSLLEVDKLVLSGVLTSEVVLTRVAYNLMVNIYGTTLEVITVLGQFGTSSTSAIDGKGIEAICFSDGTVWNLSDILARTITSGDDNPNVKDGTSYSDYILGQAGNDILNGFGGNDRIVGGTGVDTVDGSDGSDTYEWALGDGNDFINDNSLNLFENDTLVLTNVASTAVTLSRENNDLIIAIYVNGTNEVITDKDRFESAAKGYGLESIKFSDGVTWDLAELMARPYLVEGTAGSETLNGTNDNENFVGFAGNDVINGNGGVDFILGGDGTDTLSGGDGDDILDAGTGAGWQFVYGYRGSDTYVYGSNGGNVFVRGTAEIVVSSLDRVRFTDLTLGDVTLDTYNYGAGTSDGLALQFLWSDGSNSGEFRVAQEGNRIEVFEFADGTTISAIIWYTDGRPELIGTSSNDRIYGTTDSDFIFGREGDDTLSAGDHRADPGDGSDIQYLYGEGGNDSYVYSKGNGRVYIGSTAETANSGASDRVIFSDLTLGDISFSTTNYASSTAPQEGLAFNFDWISGNTAGQLSIALGAQHIEIFEFADGTTVSSISYNSTNGLTTLIGTASNDYIRGGMGFDSITGGAGDDVMDAGSGPGWQTMSGGAGDDTYIYGANGGFVFLGGTVETTTSGDADRIRFTDLALSDITLGYYDYTSASVHGNALRFSWTSGAGSGELRVGLEGSEFEVFEFADGTTVSSITHNSTSGLTSLIGTSGNDYIGGGTGYDSITGGAGDDVMDAGSGAGWQTLYGGAGDDTYLYGANGGLVFIGGTVETTTSGDADRIRFTDLALSDITMGYHDYTSASVHGNALRFNWNNGMSSGELRVGLEGSKFEIFEFADGTTVSAIAFNTLTGLTTLTGTDNGDTINGTNGVDVINGVGGDDRIDGLTGADQMAGGLGDDQYFVDNAGDSVSEIASEGIDEIHASMNYTLVANIERLYLTGSANINATGLVSKDDYLRGNSGNNTLTGLSGNDTLDGAAGSDVMIGGTGDDTYYVDSASDVITELSSQGSDIILASISATIAANVERLALTGGANINATGDAANNILIGNVGANVLDGLAGADTMQGGLGNDFYYVDNSADIVDEVTGGGGASDFIYASVSFTITASVERLYLTGTTNINATGRDNQVDMLVGNTGNNSPSGQNGNDVLYGGLGNDTLTGGTGLDLFRFDTLANSTTNKDTITDFSVADDTIQLSKNAYAGITLTGVLGASMFKNVTTGAVDADDRILYNSSTGELSYDADGFGGVAAIQFAQVAANLSLTNADFVVY